MSVLAKECMQTLTNPQDPKSVGSWLELNHADILNVPLCLNEYHNIFCRYIYIIHIVNLVSPDIFWTKRYIKYLSWKMVGESSAVF